MTARPVNLRSLPQNDPVIIMVGQPDELLAAGPRSAGLAPRPIEGDVVVWGKAQIIEQSSTPHPPRRESRTSGFLMTVADAADVLGVGRSTIYELIGRGELELLHVGRSARIPTDAVLSLIDRLRAMENRLPVCRGSSAG